MRPVDIAVRLAGFGVALFAATIISWNGVFGAKIVAFFGVFVAAAVLSAAVPEVGLAAVLVVCSTPGSLSGLPGLTIGDVHMSPAGLFTAGTGAFAALTVLANVRRIEPELIARIWPFWLVPVIALLRIPGSESTSDGAREAFLEVVPQIVAVMTAVTIGADRQRAWRVCRMVGLSALLPLAVLAAYLAGGALTIEVDRLGGPLPARQLAIFLVAALAALIAMARGEPTRPGRIGAALLAAACVLTIVATLSRLAILVAVAVTLPVGLLTASRFMTRNMLAVAGVVVLVGFAIPRWEPLQERFDEIGIGIDDFGVDFSDFRGSGRENIWPLVFASAMEAPMLGKGTGSAGALVASETTLVHPHNEFLRAFHDWGVVGLVILAVAWAGSGLRSLRRAVSLRASDPRGAMGCVASATICASMLGLFVGENVLVYLQAMAPAMILFTAGEATALPQPRMPAECESPAR